MKEVVDKIIDCMIPYGIIWNMNSDNNLTARVLDGLLEDDTLCRLLIHCICRDADLSF